MALTTLDKKPVKAEKTAWPPEIAAEFERETKNPNGCVGQRLLSENERVRVWEIRLKPGQRFGFHRHVLDYFWSVTTDGKARAYLSDGTTVEHTYKAGETRHESHCQGPLQGARSRQHRRRRPQLHHRGIPRQRQ